MIISMWAIVLFDLPWLRTWAVLQEVPATLLLQAFSVNRLRKSICWKPT